MTRHRSNGRVTAPDLHKHHTAVTGVTRPPTLTCGNTSNTVRPSAEEVITPWGQPPRLQTAIVTSSAGTSPASGSRAGSSRRDGAPGGATDTTGVTPRATPKASTAALAITPELAAAAASQHGGPGVALLILVGLGALAAWAISLYAHPFTKCGRCGGKGVTKRSTDKRFGLCKACGGTRRKQRLGSKTLHRWIQSGSSEWQRQRALKAEQRVAERTRNPRNHGGAK